MDNKILLVDCCDNGGLQLDINESASGNRLVTFRGKMQEAGTINKNKRKYPFEVLDENVQKLQETIKHRGLIGELDHPTDSIVHFEKCSHIITKLWWEGNILMGEGQILNTPHGKILRALLDDGVRVGISSRGVGNGRVDENGILVIGEGYKLITFDIVADPSTNAAFQEKVVSSKKENNNYSTNNTNFSNKNESSSIYKINKEAVLACLGGIIKQKTNNILSEV